MITTGVEQDMTTETEIQRKIVLAIWDAGMEGTRTDSGEIQVVTDDGSEFQITVVQTRGG